MNDSLVFPPSATNDSGWVIQCDFDGTISVDDVTDALLERFARPGWREIEAEWEAGRIGSGECMKRQVALLDMSKAELDDFVQSMAIDPNFASFVATAKRLGITLEIVSDGIDYAIFRILALHHLDGLSVRANHLVQLAEGRWRLTSPHASTTCVSACGTCKCELLAHHATTPRKVLFIGDGRSDFCVASKADFVLAKSKLIDHCAQHGIEHAAFNDFEGALASMLTAVHRLDVSA
ncbi:MAG: MtnX-like HAD-IB family phosphatase [Pseudomonadota bacterium]|nr:MtnX-like HAD-IB family phosphatase [Pseudomonadota bacterium]